MHGLTVRQKYNAQIAPVHLWNGCPAANAAVLLNLLTSRISYNAFDPFEADERAIRPLPDVLKVTGEPHTGKIAQALLTRKAKRSNETQD
ncbi:MAG: hypothetical protein JO354_00760 [Verrucomicrobia bacterium]|nr:hypothetical protein [Verrucomicrobiota bacterium]